MTSEATRAFIQLHQHDDPKALALRGCKNPDVDISFALQQIQGRQKAKQKLPDFFEKEDILYPVSISLEQCSSSLTAHYKTEIMAGESLIDFSGGFGVDTFAFARKVKSCHYVEPVRELHDIVMHNAQVFGLQNITFHNETMEQAIEHLEAVDVIYLDPSRRDNHGHRVITIEQCTPDVVQWKDKLLSKATQVLVKLSPMIDLKQALRQIPEIQTIHVVSIDGECKEVLLHLTKKQTENHTFKTINIQKGYRQDFIFSEAEERQSIPPMAEELGQYLYEPNASIMKAGGFKCLANRYHLQKLHPHTHLYTSNEQIENFPGRTFLIKNQFPAGKKHYKAHLTALTKANIATRNFPLTAEELKKEMELKDGGETYIFGTTWRKDEKAIILCTKS